jgi:hypothetical protein
MIRYGGWNFKCPNVAKIGVTYQTTLRNNVPVFYVGDCSYTRNRLKDMVKFDNDEKVACLLKAARHLTLEAKKEHVQLERIIDEKDVSITDLREDIQFIKSSRYAFMDAKRVKEQRERDYSPPKNIKMFKWLMVLIVFIVLFAGIGIGYGLFYYLNRDLLSMVIQP